MDTEASAAYSSIQSLRPRPASKSILYILSLYPLTTREIQLSGLFWDRKQCFCLGYKVALNLLLLPSFRFQKRTHGRSVLGQHINYLQHTVDGNYLANLVMSLREKKSRLRLGNARFALPYSDSSIFTHPGCYRISRLLHCILSHMAYASRTFVRRW